MVIGKVALATGKWINGKWVKTATETVTETVSKGRWVNGKWIKEATQPLENGRVYIKMKTATSTARTTTEPPIKLSTSKLPIDSFELKGPKDLCTSGEVPKFIYRKDKTLRRVCVTNTSGYPYKIARYDSKGQFLCNEVDSEWIALEKAFKFDEKTMFAIKQICKSKNVDMFTAGVIARSNRLKFVSTKEAAEIIKSINNKCSSKSYSASRFAEDFTKEDFDTCMIAKFIEENPEIKLSEFKKYIDNISLDKLYEIAPRLKKFNCDDMLEFFKFHFTKGTTNFNSSNLKYPHNLTDFLEKNPLNAYQIQKLLAIYPNTSRNVGCLPKKWNANAYSAEIRGILDKFRKEVACVSHKSTYIKGNPIVATQQELSNILGKKVIITELDTGKFAKAYKISVDGADDVVMKVFHKKPLTAYDNFNVNGEFIEPQRGMFLSANSEKFAKTYYGKISTEIDKDGYILTEYLEKSDKVVPQSEFIKLKDYFVFCDDVSEGHNIINGKIYDFGDIHIVHC